MSNRIPQSDEEYENDTQELDDSYDACFLKESCDPVPLDFNAAVVYDKWGYPPNAIMEG